MDTPTMTKTKPYTPQKERLLWDKALTYAEERLKRGETPFPPKIIEAGAEWPTCACGTADTRIPKEEGNRPLDSTLRVLGKKFSKHLYSANDSFVAGYMEESMLHIEEARDCMAAIDERGAIVITLTERLAGRNAA